MQAFFDSSTTGLNGQETPVSKAPATLKEWYAQHVANPPIPMMGYCPECNELIDVADNFPEDPDYYQCPECFSDFHVSELCQFFCRNCEESFTHDNVICDVDAQNYKCIQCNTVLISAIQATPQPVQQQQAQANLESEKRGQETPVSKALGPAPCNLIPKVTTPEETAAMLATLSQYISPDSQLTMNGQTVRGSRTPQPVQQQQSNAGQAKQAEANRQAMFNVLSQHTQAHAEAKAPLTVLSEAELGLVFRLIAAGLMATEYNPLMKKVIYVNEAAKVLTEMVTLFNDDRKTCGCVGSVWCLECRLKLTDLLLKAGVMGKELPNG